MNNTEYNTSFEFKLTDEEDEEFKKILSTSELSNEITIGFDYGNGKSVQATGSFVNINFKYKRIKRGKKYKLFKMVNSPYLIMQFISKDLEVYNE